jgi:hypothetical protein
MPASLPGGMMMPPLYRGMVLPHLLGIVLVSLWDIVLVVPLYRGHSTGPTISGS